jgi:hypothetical protein
VQGGSKDGKKTWKDKKKVTFDFTPDMSWKKDREQNDMWKKRKIEKVEKMVEEEGEMKKRRKENQAVLENGEKQREQKQSGKANAPSDVLTRAMVKKQQGEPRQLRQRVK